MFKLLEPPVVINSSEYKHKPWPKIILTLFSRIQNCFYWKSRFTILTHPLLECKSYCLLIAIFLLTNLLSPQRQHFRKEEQLYRMTTMDTKISVTSENVPSTWQKLLEISVRYCDANAKLKIELIKDITRETEFSNIGM